MEALGLAHEAYSTFHQLGVRDLRATVFARVVHLLFKISEMEATHLKILFNEPLLTASQHPQKTRQAPTHAQETIPRLPYRPPTERKHLLAH